MFNPFAAPDLGDPERIRRGEVLIRAILSVTAVGILGAAVVGGLSEAPAQVVIVTAVLVTTGAFTIGLVHANWLETAAHLFVGSLWLAGLGTTADYGGVGGVGTVSVVTAVLAAGLLLPRRSALGVAAASSLVLFGYAAFEIEIEREIPPTSVELLAVGLVGVALTLIFVSLAVRSLERALFAAHEAQRQAAALIDASPDAIVTLNASGRILAANPAAAELVRFADPIGIDFARALGVDPSLLPSPSSFTSRDTTLFQCTASLDQGLVPLEVHGSILDRQAQTVQLVIRDISARAAAEQLAKAMETRLREGQRLESLGQLAGGIAHDFNNVLTAILTVASMTAETKGLPEEVRQNMDLISEAGKRAASLTRQLLAFARKQVMEPRVLALSESVQQVEGLLKRLLPENYELELIATGEGLVRADPAQLEQVLVNLVVNARDAMPDGGKIRVETVPARLTSAQGEGPNRMEPGDYVRLTVTDSGRGMDTQTVSRVFEPFFTTKRMGSGTGLGLATVHGIVKQSGGHITVYSEVDRGTSFHVYFPRVDEPRSPPSLPPTAAVPSGGLVLLVDDDALVRTTAQQTLRHLGYEVIVATSGDHALSLLGGLPHLDLLLTDVVMPGMSGPDLARALGQRRPDVPVLFMSGYTEDAMLTDGELSAGVQFINKPFTPAMLSQRIEEVLSGSV